MPSLVLPSFKRQQLLLEYAAIKSQCPEGIYLSPGTLSAAIWSGVFFVREGPYASAVLPFELTFPSTYPEVGPSVAFSTEIFHPLLVPLTTYTFAASALDPNATVSSSETERLPPGSFNLHDGFPSWYGGKSDGRSLRTSSTGGNPIAEGSADQGRIQPTETAPLESVAREETRTLPALLQYIERAFNDAMFLDSLPLRAAVNVNAWHAWRAHRGLPKLGSRPISPVSAESGRTPISPRLDPGDWNWDGVWESRVKNGIQESMNDAVLFGNKSNRVLASTSGSIRFAKNDDETILDIQRAMVRALGLDNPAQ